MRPSLPCTLTFFILFFILGKAEAQNKENDTTSRLFSEHLVSLQVGAYSIPQVRVFMLYETPLIYPQDPTSSWKFNWAALLGLGIGYTPDQLDTVNESRYILAGTSFGPQYIDKHQFEINLFLLYDWLRSGYLTADGEPWNLQSALDFSFGYRLEGNTTVFRLMLNPSNDGDVTTFFPSVSLGIKF